MIYISDSKDWFILFGNRYHALLAYGGINSSWFGDESTDNVGWTIGAGVEYALTNNWTVRVEGLYVNLGANDRTVALPGPGGIYTVTGGSGDGGGVARVGLNYKF